MSKLDKKKFLVCCANGAGSSLTMKMTLQKVLDKFGIRPDALHHCSLSEGKSSARRYDVVFCARNFSGMFAGAQKDGTIVIGLKNIMSPTKMEQSLRSAGLIDTTTISAE